jgi:hypothetical protein
MFLFAVNHLSGQARLQFTRHPYTHWSFSFFGDPVLELQVESQFQGRPLPQITSIIVSQVIPVRSSACLQFGGSFLIQVIWSSGYCFLYSVTSESRYR